MTRGARFRKDVRKQYADPDPAQAVLIDRIVALLDRIELAEAQIAEDGQVTTGGNGQMTAHPLIASARQDSIAVAKLLSTLIPAESDSDAKRRAARARWDKSA